MQKGLKGLKKITNNMALSEEKGTAPTRWKTDASLADVQLVISGNEGHLENATERADEINEAIERIASRLFKYGACCANDGDEKKLAEGQSVSNGLVNDINSRLQDHNSKLHVLLDKLIDAARALSTLEEELFG